MISFTVLTSDAAGVCLLGKKGFTRLRFATLVPWADVRFVHAVTAGGSVKFCRLCKFLQKQRDLQFQLSTKYILS